MKKLLIANRGEIALRIVRACRDLGIRSVAVYSEPDRTALHVRAADEAYLLGPGPAQDSYLNIARLLEVAKACGAEALHPGYGFLAENAAFADACAGAGLTFIGPLPQAMRLLGDKVMARQIMREARVPLVAGTELIESAEAAAALAAELGFPVLVKAAGGGGGRGIREVQSPEELEDALEIAAAEAQIAFGNPHLYLEKYLRPVRHVEIQILADNYGNIVALGERECSIQRRHQKIIEEAPSTAVDAELRSRLMEAAITAAKAVDYRNAGTVEFLLDQEKRFYFLEVNTRIQVEHPITELITGVDVVRDQIRVAMGEPLPYRQEDIALHGWAIECRIAAEDPFNNFFPSVGSIKTLREPSGPGVRVDSSLYPNQEVSLYYDSLLAKVCAWGSDRKEAIRRMQRALSEYIIIGVKTNLPFHIHVMADPNFQQGNFHTSFVDEVSPSLLESSPQRTQLAVLAAALLAHSKGRGPMLATKPARSQGASPWTTSFRPQPGYRGFQRMPRG